MDNVDYGYKISCGKRKNRTGICTCAADSVDKLWIICRLLSGTIRIRLEQSGSPMSITGLVFAAGCGLRGKYTAADTPLSRVLRSFSKKNGNPLPNAGKIGYLCLPEPAALPGLRTGPSGHRSGGPGPIRRTRTNLKRIADMKRLLLFCAALCCGVVSALHPARQAATTAHNTTHTIISVFFIAFSLCFHPAH